MQCSRRVAQALNYEDIARDVGIDSKTVRAWLSILEASGLVMLIRPFSNNQLTRVIKNPKLYFMDTGLVTYLLRWLSPETLRAGAMSGPILENYAVSEIIKSFANAGYIDPPLSFYRDRDQREIDLIVEADGRLYPIEIKATATPQRSMAKQFKLLERAQGFKMGKQVILCQVQRIHHLSEDLIAYPIGAI